MQIKSIVLATALFASVQAVDSYNSTGAIGGTNSTGGGVAPVPGNSTGGGVAPGNSSNGGAAAGNNFTIPGYSDDANSMKIGSAAIAFAVGVAAILI